MPDVTGLYRRFGVRLPGLGDGWASTRCFSGRHRDRNPSARVHLRSGGFRCFACNEAGGVLDALQLLGVHDRGEARRLAIEYGILDPPRKQRPPAAVAPPRAETVSALPPQDGDRVDWDNLPDGPAIVRDRTWEYVDENDVPVGRVRRLDLADGTKRIWQERPDGGRWLPGMDGLRLPLYRLPKVLEHARKSERVLVVEGEKAVDALDRLGLFATTCPGGAGKWRDEHTAALTGATVVAIPDCDQAGRLHAIQLTDALLTAGVNARMPLELNELSHDGYDIVDDLAALADTLRGVAPEISGAAIRERLRDHLERQLTRLPATAGDLQRLRERVRYQADPTGRLLLPCGRCGHERVHHVSHGLAFCPCGAQQPAPE